MTSSTAKSVAAGVEKFLNDQIASGDLDSDQIESLQVALQCIQAVYGLDSEPVECVPDFVAVLHSKPSKAQIQASEADMKEAERLKGCGNEHLSAGRAGLAIECYSKAIALDPTNTVFYSNRAAAYQKEGKYDAAIKDCKEALAIDPSFVKAYTRLGAAYAAQKKTEKAREAYEKAISLDPSNDVARIGLEALQPTASRASPSASAGRSKSPFGGMKMPGNMDLASLMNNPEMMAMAQKMMNSGAMDKMMKDPKMMEMMSSMMGGMNVDQPEEE